MKTVSRFIPLFVAFILTLSGCELYYVPPHLQSPSHEKKGDIAINVQGLYTASGSASYAFSDHGFIGASVMGYQSSNNDTVNSDYFRTATLEGGYYNFDSTTNIQVEIMAGVGAGEVGDSYGLDADFNRFYIQPGVAFLTRGRVVENHLNFRFSNISYMEQKSRNIDPFRTVFFEPSYTFRVGSPNVKFHMQLGLSARVNSSGKVPIEFVHDPLIIGFGVNAKLNVFGKVNGG